MAVAETVVAAWVLIAGEVAHFRYSTHRFVQEFTTKERCERAASSFLQEFDPARGERLRAFCVPK